MQQVQLEFLRWLQGFFGPAFVPLAELATYLGEPVCLAALFCAVYWCWNKELGRGLLFSLCASMCLNGFIKDLIKFERPIGQEGIVSNRVKTATGYAFPSGHTQAAASFWSVIFFWTKRNWVRLLAVGIVLAVGWSRMVLGVHYPVDVLGGIFFGALTAWVFQKLVRERRGKLAALLCIALALLALLVGESKDTFAAVGMMCGLYPGLVLERRYSGFAPGKPPLLRLAARYFLGLFLVGLIYYPPKLLLPRSPLVSAVTYGLLSLFVVGIYPCIFKRLRL